MEAFCLRSIDEISIGNQEQAHKHLSYFEPEVPWVEYVSVELGLASLLGTLLFEV